MVQGGNTMKLAPISNPRVEHLIVEYSQENNFAVLEIAGEEEFPCLTLKFQECLKLAEQKGCTEICFKEIQQKYNIMLDRVKWKIVIYGFIPKQKN